MEHACDVDAETLAVIQHLGPHSRCTVTEEATITMYTLFWGHRFALIMHKGGQCSIMDYRKGKSPVQLFASLEDAIPCLSESLFYSQ